MKKYGGQYEKEVLSLLVLPLSVVVGLSVLTACSGGDNCQHEYGEWQVVKEQTCTEKGSLLKKIKLGSSFNPQKNYGGLNSSGLLETIDLGTNT